MKLTFWSKNYRKANTENFGSLTLLGVFFEKSNSMLVTLKIQCYVVRFLGDLNFTVSEVTSNSEFSLLAMKISLLIENFPVTMLNFKPIFNPENLF